MWILCPAEDSLETSSLIFSEKNNEKYLWMSSAAVVTGALRLNFLLDIQNFMHFETDLTTLYVHLSIDLQTGLVASKKTKG